MTGPERTPHLRLLVFTVGAGSLGAEIAAARLLAPYFGASTIVWANTIATVLLALSAGYWLGGRLADRDPNYPQLCRLVLFAALGLAAIPFVAQPLLDLAANALDDVAAGAFVGSLVGVLGLVAGPVLLLGMVSPYALRLALERVEDAGVVAGRLYALSTAGSLAGVFLSALVLIPLVGTQRTFLSFAIALAAIAATGLPRRALLAPFALTALLAVPAGAIKGSAGDDRVIDEAETEYQYARVVEEDDGTRTLELNEGQAVHSTYSKGRFLTDGYWDDALALPAAALGRQPRRLAILGSAAGTTARAYGRYFPRTEVDAVEIDGELVELGRRWFDLRERPGLRLVTADARPFLRGEPRGRYDAILVDAYRQPYIPFYLATQEFFALCRSRLEPGGVVMVNIGHPEGSERLEQVLTRTAGAVFHHTARDPVRDTNTWLLASDSPLRGERITAAAADWDAELTPLATRLRARLAEPLRGGSVYTDDRAPVEWLVDGSLLGYASDR